MGLLRLTRTGRARLGAIAGLLAVIAGVWVLYGLGVTLIVAGSLTVGVFLLLYDVEGGAPVEPPAVHSPQRLRFDPTL